MSLLNIDYFDNDAERKPMPITARADIFLSAMRTSPPGPASFISLTLTDPVAAKALRLFSGELDWDNLYRIYEVINENSAGIVESEWATTTEINRFKMSANNSSITGDASRHGKSHSKVAANPGISQAQAIDLVRRLLRQWLDARRMSSRP